MIYRQKFKVDPDMKRPKLIFLFLVLLALSMAPQAMAKNDRVRGYKKPEICMKTGARCILRKFGNTTYWCIKKDLQRTLDSRRSTSPIRKTGRGNMGNCAKTIPIVEPG